MSYPFANHFSWFLHNFTLAIVATSSIIIRVKGLRDIQIQVFIPTVLSKARHIVNTPLLQLTGYLGLPQKTCFQAMHRIQNDAFLLHH